MPPDPLEKHTLHASPAMSDHHDNMSDHHDNMSDYHDNMSDHHDNMSDHHDNMSDQFFVWTDKVSDHFKIIIIISAKGYFGTLTKRLDYVGVLKCPHNR